MIRNRNLFCKILSGPELKQDPSLLDKIIDLDKVNMTPILEASGIKNFDWSIRLRAFDLQDTKLIILLDHDLCIGYVEFTKDWKDANNIYLTSIQIANEYRGTSVFRKLIVQLVSELKSIPFTFITSNVQKSNTKMIAMFQKFGLEICHSESKTTIDVRATKSILENSHIKTFFSLRPSSNLK